MSDLISLHDLPGQLDKGVAVERLAEAQGVKLEPGTGVRRGWYRFLSSLRSSLTSDADITKPLPSDSPSWVCLLLVGRPSGIPGTRSDNDPGYSSDSCRPHSQSLSGRRYRIRVWEEGDPKEFSRCNVAAQTCVRTQSVPSAVVIRECRLHEQADRGRKRRWPACPAAFDDSQGRSARRDRCPPAPSCCRTRQRGMRAGR